MVCFDLLDPKSSLSARQLKKGAGVKDKSLPSYLRSLLAMFRSLHSSSRACLRALYAGTSSPWLRGGSGGLVGFGLVRFGGERGEGERCAVGVAWEGEGEI